MATKIEWADSTLNPIVGCNKISSGCLNCYAERMARRLSTMGHGYYKDVIGDNGKWNGKLSFNPAVMQKAINWKKPKRIFINSMSDTFHEDVEPLWLAMIFDVMARCPQHTFMILTKRPENALRHYDNPMLRHFFELPNVWLGVTCENQETANKRIPILLQIPAAKRFVSVEPMLGPMDMNKLPFETKIIDSLTGATWYRSQIVRDVNLIALNKWENKLDWVICGGESGPGARRLEPDWVEFIVSQCRDSNTPLFFKSWGEYDGCGERVGKKNTGALVWGSIYDQYPL